MERKTLILLAGLTIVLLMALILLVKPSPEVGQPGRKIEGITMVTDIGGLAFSLAFVNIEGGAIT